MVAPLLVLAPIALGIVDKIVSGIAQFFGDRAKAEMMRLEIEKIVYEHLRDVDTAQAEINKAEAASPHWFVAGWRPFIGWACGFGVVYAWIVQPIANATLSMFNSDIYLPDAEIESMISLLVAMLGLAGIRTVEKLRGVS